MSFIALESISKTYSTGTTALRNISFGLNRGSRMALVGPSGCGKTSLLNLLAGLDVPTSGEILIDGHLPARSPFKTAFVFQTDAVFPWLTVRQNVAYPLSLHRFPNSAIESR